MSISLRQEDTPVTAGGSGVTTLTTNSLPGPAVVGSVMELWIAYGTGGGVPTLVKDSANQTYSLVGSVTDATDTSVLALYALTNNQSNTALTVTVTWSAPTTFCNAHAREISGAKNQLPDTFNFPARIVAPGTGANAISVPLTNGGAPALLSGVVCAVAGSGNLVAGSGFTGTLAFAAGGGFNASLFETQRVTAAGSNPCTWTDPTNGGTSTYLGGAVVWDEAAVAIVGGSYSLSSDEYF